MNEAVLPKRADAVVIGGGVVGCSLLYSLVKAGLKDVILLERDQLGCGTTWHSAANIALVDASSRTYVEYYAYNMNLFRSLAEETGQEVGWHQTGRLQLATSEMRARVLKNVQDVAVARGLVADWVSPEEAQRRLPIMSTDGLLGALWMPTAGRVSATDLLAAFTKGARTGGAQVAERTRVRAIGLQDGRVARVETDRGTIETERVINCAGLWAPQIARMVGVDLPIHANEHFYMLTKPLEGVDRDMPSFRDSDALIYGREEVGGLLLGCFERRAKPIAAEALPDDFSFALLPDDWDQFEPYMLEGLRRFPVLEHAEVKLLLNGPESFTPDGRFIAGAVPEVPGFYVLAGMNSAGINNAAGASRALVQLMLEGRSELDLTSFAPLRFAPFHSRPAWLRERTSEAPSQFYSVARPRRDFETGRDLRLSPLHHRLAAAGARFGSVMGWERVEEVGGVAGEIELLRNEAGLADLSPGGRLLLAGAGAGELIAERLGGIALQEGSCAMALAGDADGVASALLVVREEAERYLLLGDPQHEWLDRALLRPAAGGPLLLPLQSALACLLIDGPQAGEVLRAAAGDVEVPEPGSCRRLVVGGAEALVLSHPWSRALLLLVESEFADHLTARLLAAGEGRLSWVGWQALEEIRIARRLPAIGHELVAGVAPTASGLARGPDGRWEPNPSAGLLWGRVAGALYGGEPISAEGRAVGFVSSAGPLQADGHSGFLARVSEHSGPLSLRLEGESLAVSLGRE